MTPEKKHQYKMELAITSINGCINKGGNIERMNVNKGSYFGENAVQLKILHTFLSNKHNNI